MITTFWLFAAIFTILLVAEVSIMVRYVQKKDLPEPANSVK